jgi:nitroreductase
MPNNEPEFAILKGMNPNYRAWDISFKDFSGQGSEPAKLKFILRFAILAPSGHNTQPWNFSIAGNEISLLVNRERSLEGSDPHRHQLLLAFGCMIENLIIAGTHYGYEIKMDYFPDMHNHDLIAKISFKEKAGDSKDNNEKSGSNLISAIPLRHTNRGKYLDKQLPESFLKQIEKYPISDQKISIVTDQAQKNTIADIVNEAQMEAMDSDVFREELSHYIKSSFTKEHAGMPGFALEIPAPISLFASRLIKKVNLSRKSEKKDEALLKHHTPGGFIVISSRSNNREEWLEAGRLFERIWLTATAEGLNCSPMAAAIQSPKHNEQLKQALGIDFEPQVFFRIGYGEKQFRHSPRFSIDQLLI